MRNSHPPEQHGVNPWSLVFVTIFFSIPGALFGGLLLYAYVH